MGFLFANASTDSSMYPVKGALVDRLLLLVHVLSNFLLSTVLQIWHEASLGQGHLIVIIRTLAPLGPKDTDRFFKNFLYTLDILKKNYSKAF
jgi:hypothetical protein